MLEQVQLVIFKKVKMDHSLIKQADEEISIDNECNLKEDDIEWNNIKSVDEEETTNLFSQPELDSSESLSSNNTAFKEEGIMKRSHKSSDVAILPQSLYHLEGKDLDDDIFRKK